MRNQSRERERAANIDKLNCVLCEGQVHSQHFTCIPQTPHIVSISNMHTGLIFFSSEELHQVFNQLSLIQKNIDL